MIGGILHDNSFFVLVILKVWENAKVFIVSHWASATYFLEFHKSHYFRGIAWSSISSLCWKIVTTNLQCLCYVSRMLHVSPPIVVLQECYKYHLQFIRCVEMLDSRVLHVSPAISSLYCQGVTRLTPNFLTLLQWCYTSHLQFYHCIARMLHVSPSISSLSCISALVCCVPLRSVQLARLAALGKSHCENSRLHTRPGAQDCMTSTLFTHT